MKQVRTVFCILLIAALCGCSVNAPAASAPGADTSPQTTPTASSSTPSAAEQILAQMTVEEKVGQIFLARCPATNAVADISTYHLGGYILFGRDFKNETPESITATLGSYQDASAIPLLIAVDEEGGTVTRVSAYPAFREARFPSPRSLFEDGGLSAVLAAEEEKALLLSSLGINVNMAPVCDITTDSASFMYKRSLGQSPDVTAAFIADTVAIMQEYHVGSVLKHFPGYGNNTDTHIGIAVDNRSLEELESQDLIPFAAGIEAGCGAILVSHTFVNCLDSEYPATLSPAVHTYLRQEMGFSGVIVTDDLQMEAVRSLYGDGESAVLAVLAGNDLLCASSYQTQYQAVLEAVQSGRIPMEILDAAVLRVLEWKISLGLIPSNV